jgi:hypothetical protein
MRKAKTRDHGLTERLVSLLQGAPEKVWTVSEAEAALSRRWSRHSVGGSLVRLANDGLVERAGRGLYRWAGNGAHEPEPAMGSEPPRHPQPRQGRLDEREVGVVAEVVRNLKDGRWLLEDSDGGLWIARRLEEL